MSHAQVNVVVHIVWGTRHRTPSLPPSLDLQLEALLAALAREAKCSLLLAGIASDHVHTLVRVGATASLADVAYLRRQRAHHDDSHPAELWQLATT